MKALVKNKGTLLTFRIIVGIVFIYAGIEKISDPESFAVSIENYRVLPVQFVNLVAIPLPWLELFSGILLVFGIALKENSIIINTLLVVFIVLILSALLRGLDIDCGCFGTLDGQKVGIQKIAENIILLLLGTIIHLYDNNPIKLN